MSFDRSFVLRASLRTNQKQAFPAIQNASFFMPRTVGSTPRPVVKRTCSTAAAARGSPVAVEQGGVHPEFMLFAPSNAKTHPLTVFVLR